MIRSTWLNLIRIHYDRHSIWCLSPQQHSYQGLPLYLLLEVIIFIIDSLRFGSWVLLIYLMSILIMFWCWLFIWCSVWRRVKQDDNNNWLLWGELMSRPLLTHNWLLLSSLNTLSLINSRMRWILLFFPNLILIGLSFV